MNYPFEFHVTVKEESGLGVNGFWNKFRTYIQNNVLGVKPIYIMNITSGFRFYSDFLTSSTFVGTTEGALKQLSKISSQLIEGGFDVIREKIETVPYYEYAPSIVNNKIMPRGSYFESHIKVKEPKLKDLLEYSLTSDLFLSTSYKNAADDYQTIMATYRSYSQTVEEFTDNLLAQCACLREAGFVVEESNIEFALYDSNPDHDQQWMS